MRIGLDLHVLTGPHQGTSSAWINLLTEFPSTHEYVLYSPDPPLLQRRFPQPHFIHRRIRRMPSAARIQLAFPFMTYRDRCDVLHSNYYGPLVGSPPIVLHVHDLIYLDFPEYSTGVRRALFATLGRASAHAAARVVTGSEWSKRRIVDWYGIEPHRVDVVKCGLDRSWVKPDQQHIDDAWRLVQARVPQRYALAVGRLDPRKNFGQAARATRALVARGLLDGLVVVGPQDFGAAGFRRELERDGTGALVTHLSGLDTASLQALYQHAEFLLYISLAEGFGLPLIEAMAMGTPIIASNRTSIPEVTGDAGKIVDPDDLDQIVAATSELLQSPEIRSAMVTRGTARARMFDGAAAASQMLAVYAAATRSR